jgi:hypothetical protein
MTRARVNRVRDADKTLIDRAYPGLKCKRLKLDANTFSGYSVEYMLEGSIEALVTHRLATREQLESLPPCGVRRDYRRVGEGVYQVRRYFFDCLQSRDYYRTDGQDEIRRLGLPLPTMPAKGRELRIGRASDAAWDTIRWETDGDVIYVDWADRRGQVATQRALLAEAAGKEEARP